MEYFLVNWQLMVQKVKTLRAGCVLCTDHSGLGIRFKSSSK